MATVKTFINKSYVRSDGACRIYILIELRGKKIKFDTGITSPPEKFDQKNQRIKGSTKQVKDDNLVIRKCMGRVNDIFVRYRLLNRDLTPDLLKNEYKNPARFLDFYKFMQEEIEKRKGDLAPSSLKQHKACLQKMKEFKNELAFSELSIEFIQDFRRFLKIKKKNNQNTIFNNLKNLRTYINIAVNLEIILKNPFDAYKLKKPGNSLVYLSTTELKLLVKYYNNYTLPDNYQKVLRAYLFCCFTGLRISDVIRCSHDWIVGDFLIYTPQKSSNLNNKTIKIPLCNMAKRLIGESGTSSGTVFLLFAEQTMRDRIKQIVVRAGINKDINWHTSRHTFASVFLETTRDVVTLQQFLGHSRIQDTMIYVHVTEGVKQERIKEFGSLFI